MHEANKPQTSQYCESVNEGFIQHFVTLFVTQMDKGL